MSLLCCFRFPFKQGNGELVGHVKKLIEIHRAARSALSKINKIRISGTDRRSWLERTEGLGFMPSLERGADYIQQEWDRLVTDKGRFVLHGDGKRMSMAFAYSFGH